MNRRSFINLFLALPLIKYIKLEPKVIVISKYNPIYGLPYQQNMDYSGTWLGIKREDPGHYLRTAHHLNTARVPMIIKPGIKQ